MGQSIVLQTADNEIVLQSDAGSITLGAVEYTITLQSLAGGGGGGGTTDHSDLSNLAWADSGHTGTASEFAGFDGDGATTTYGQDDIDHTAISNIGSNTHAQIDTHIANTDIHFTEASIDHTSISNIGSNTHDQIDSHIADTDVHFTEASIDHTAISNIGSNTHAQVDSHIADTDIHFEKSDVAYSDLDGNPSDTITAGTNLSWDGDTLNSTGGGTGDHSALSNLPWTDSGHTGTVNTLPAFDASGTAIGGPRSLTSNTTFYVRTSGASNPGNDSNTGLVNDAAGAWLTIQHALDEAENTLSNGYTMTIQVADDDITESCIFNGMLDGGEVILLGNTTTPADVTWGASATWALALQSQKAWVSIDGFTMGGGTTSYALIANNGSLFEISDNDAMVFDECSFRHIRAFEGTIKIQGNYSIIGDANIHWQLSLSGTLVCVNRTITLTGTPDFDEFLSMDRQARCQINSNTFSGSATGSRFDITGCSFADTGDAGLTYLPGDAGGTLSTGGCYDGIAAFEEVQLPDNGELLLGTAGDASFKYDGTDLICNPQEVGSGGYICYYNKSLYFQSEYDNGSKTTNFTVDWDSNGQKQKATLTANTITLTLDNPANGVGNFTLKLVNGGLATLTWAATSGSVNWADGTAPSLTSSGTDIVTFYYDGTDFYGVASLDFS